MLFAICAINAIWFIITSCNAIGFMLFIIAPMSIPCIIGIMPGAGAIPLLKAFTISCGIPPPRVTASILAWISSRACPPLPPLPPIRSNKLRPPSRCIARGPVGRSVRRALFGPCEGDGDRAEAARFCPDCDPEGSACWMAWL
jgi:hypothetical protein